MHTVWAQILFILVFSYHWEIPHNSNRIICELNIVYNNNLEECFAIRIYLMDSISLYIFYFLQLNY